jgi:hypothetical protein
MDIRLFKNRLLGRPKRSVSEILLRSLQMYGGDSSEIHLSILRRVASSAFRLDANSCFSIVKVQNAYGTPYSPESFAKILECEHLLVLTTHQLPLRAYG